MLMTLNCILSFIVLWSAICATNRMTRTTKFFIRVAYIALGTGAFAEMIYPFLNYSDFKQPSFGNFMLTLAIAIMVIWDRRRSMFRHLK